MPAITVGLNEIEARLRALRRRLNLVALQHAVYLSGSVVVLVSTGLIVLALRASASTFRIAAWGTVGMALGAAAAGTVFLRMRWLDAQATAYLADRRAQLTDRLATIVDLCLRPRPSRLAPVVIAQTLSLGARWHPQQIAPRRIPRSIFVLLASLLALVSTVFIARREPHPASSSAVTAAGAGSDSALPDSQSGSGNSAAGERAAAGSNAKIPMNSLSGASAQGPGTSAADASIDLPSQRKALTSLTALPDRLQETIRHAFHAEVVGKARELAARPESPAGNGRDGRDRSADSDAHGRKPADKGALGAGTQQSPPIARDQEQKRPGQPTSGEHLAQRQESTTPDQSLDGHAPAAGDGSNPSTLMESKAAAVAVGSDGPKTFKLTITSFLRAVEQPGNQRREPGKRAGGLGNGGSTSGGQVALSDRQLSDDALRKAEVPAEYEDVVRRVYSARAGQ